MYTHVYKHMCVHSVYRRTRADMHVCVHVCMVYMGFPAGPDDKESTCSMGDPGLIPGGEDPPEKGMAAHSRTFAWRISWTEEPGGLQPMGLQRVTDTWCTHK